MNSKIKTYSLYKKPEKQTNKSAVFRKNVEQLKFLIKNSDICVKRLVSASTIDNKMMYLVYLLEKYYIKEYNIKILQMKCN